MEFCDLRERQPSRVVRFPSLASTIAFDRDTSNGWTFLKCVCTPADFQKQRAIRRRVLALAVVLAGFTLSTGTATAWDSYCFDIPSGGKESLWRDALAETLDGQTEQKTAAGRVDVTTSNAVFELDWVRKWKEGMGQVLAYSGETGKKPVLALIAYSQGVANLTPETKATLAQAEKECARHAVRLIVLFPTLPEAFPHTRTNHTERN